MQMMAKGMVQWAEPEREVTIFGIEQLNSRCYEMYNLTNYIANERHRKMRIFSSSSVLPLPLHRAERLAKSRSRHFTPTPPQSGADAKLSSTIRPTQPAHLRNVPYPEYPGHRNVAFPLFFRILVCLFLASCC